jgi:aminoglycoside phosphotransferase (APT) family kinase protein
MAQLDGIIARLEPTLGKFDPTHPVVPLDGGITNRNYRLQLGYGQYVVRLPGKDTELLGISREAERIACETAARLGVGPAVAAVDEESLVTAFVDAPPLDAQALRAKAGGIESVARALRAFHDSGAELPVRFWVPDLILDYARVVRARGGKLPREYARARELARTVGAALPLDRPVPCHNDLLAGNLMLAGGGALIVDWEYAGIGHRIFDLGNLAVNNGFDDEAEQRLLSTYLDAEPSERQHAALKLMRIMSDAREAAWGVVQQVISELDFDFAGYAQTHFDRLAAAAADPSFDAWLSLVGTGVEL